MVSDVAPMAIGRIGRAERLKHAMAKRGVLGVNELDRQAKLGAGWTSRFLDEKKPKKRPGPDTIERVCAALRIRPEWLLHGRGPMEAAPPAPMPDGSSQTKLRTPTPPRGVVASFHPDIDAIVLLARNRKQWSIGALLMADEITREKPIAPEQLERILDQLEKELRRVKASHMK